MTLPSYYRRYKIEKQRITSTNREFYSHQKETAYPLSAHCLGTSRICLPVLPVNGPGPCCRHVDESRNNYEGCIRKNLRYFYNCGHRYRFCCPFAYELQQIWKNCRRIPCMVKTYCYFMGNLKWLRFHPCLCNTILRRRKVEWLIGRRNDSWVFLTASWNG